MTRRMLIDGAHPEEVRVVITEASKILDYDVESSTKTQNKGNIYLAKVVRVEPSLQAAFVDYGGDRHGFLAFSEIHPDYYQIPIEDREALKKHVAEFEQAATAAKEHLAAIDGSDEIDLDEEYDEISGNPDDDGEIPETTATSATPILNENTGRGEDIVFLPVDKIKNNSTSEESETQKEFTEGNGRNLSIPEKKSIETLRSEELVENTDKGPDPADSEVETDTLKELPEKNTHRRQTNASGQFKRYKIQEVIKRNQVILVQVVKEERGNKGAALTTYISLAGRYCVLMPNVTRGNGGVSRKITNTIDRRRLRDLLKSLKVPDGMGVIMRTAGMQRNKSEIKRDFDYLMRLWEDVRSITLESSAPSLVYEEGDLVKRAIRDLYTREVEEIWVEGTGKYQSAKKLMRMMMPSHAKRVQPYKDTSMPMFHRYQVENQIEAMHNPTVQLKSGGYLVINPTEALVAIDVNSGRATRERNIEETATATNLEAATEIAYQLKLRDLAGLIVIDFIDMEDRNNQRTVERRFREAVKADRARIQVGRISIFGLLELSRQRMRPSLVENSTQPCPHCEGSGNLRSTESMSLHALRLIEEEGTRMRSEEVSITLSTRVALYLLNEKRNALDSMEAKYGFRIRVFGDDTIGPADIQLERVKSKSDKSDPDLSSQVASADENGAGSTNVARKKRSRRRRKKNSDQQSDTDETNSSNETSVSSEAANIPETKTQDSNEKKLSRRRRGRRGGRRRNNRGKPHYSNPVDDVEKTENTDKNEHLSGSSQKKNTHSSLRNNNKSDPKENDFSAEKINSTSESVENKNSDQIKEKSSKVSEEKPKRGWWQKILD